MKILQFMASEKWGGAEKVFVDLSNKLSTHHSVSCLVLRETDYLQKFSPDVAIIELSSNPTRHNPFLFLEIAAVIKKLQPDIVHTHAAKASELVHRLSPFIKINHLGTKHNARKGRIFNKLKYVTVVSEEGKRSVSSKVKGTVEVIHNGLESRDIAEQKKSEIFTIVAVGRLDKIKGFDTLIEQMRFVEKKCVLKIIGSGPEQNNLQRLIDKLSLEGVVSLEGFRDDVPEILSSADLTVISSLSEGFPNIMIETIFYGNMILSTPVGGIKEILPDMFLCSHDALGKKINEIIENYGHYNSEFIKIQEDQRDTLHLANIVKEYETVYQKMLTSKQQGK